MIINNKTTMSVKDFKKLQNKLFKPIKSKPPEQAKINRSISEPPQIKPFNGDIF